MHITCNEPSSSRFECTHVDSNIVTPMRFHSRLYGIVHAAKLGGLNWFASRPMQRFSHGLDVWRKSRLSIFWLMEVKEVLTPEAANFSWPLNLALVIHNEQKV